MINTTQRLKELMNEVEELLAELSEDHGPEIAALRGRVEATIASAREAVSLQARTAKAKIGEYASSVDEYITANPRVGVLAGVLLGGIAVYLAGLAKSRD